MKRYRLFFCFLLSIVMVISMVQNIHAETTSIVSEYLTEEGKNLYESGNADEALKSFSKAILADPNNEEAKEYLKEMGIEEGLYNQPISPTQRIINLKGEVDNRKEEILDLEIKKNEQDIKYNQMRGELTSENTKLRQTAESQKGKIENLNLEVHVVKSDLKHTAEKNGKTINKLKNYSKDQKRQVDMLMRMARKHLNVIDGQGDLIEERNEDVNNLHQHVVLVKNQSLQEISINEELMHRKVEGHKKRISDLRKEVKRISGTKNKHRQKARLCKRQLEKFNRSLKNQENKLEELEDTILLKDLALLRKEKSSLRQKEDLDAATQELAYITQKIDHRPEIDEMFAVDQQEEILDRIQLLKHRDKSIAVLKEKLVDAIKKIKMLERDSSGVDSADMRKLRREINNIREELRGKDVSLLEKNTEYDVLEERLMDAKERLGFVEKIIEEKDEEIDGLKSELIQIRDNCIR